MAIPSIESVFPANGAVGIPIGTTIWMIFDEEIDPTTLAKNIIVEGPDTDRWTGPDMALYDLPDTEETENFLESPNFKGIVQGAFTLELLTDAGGSASSNPSGADGFKHKVVFTPNYILSPETEYLIYISGDEDTDDALISGISARTVFDAQKGTNYGDGTLVPYGGYTGAIADTFNFKITKTGGLGTAEYEWYLSSAPSIKRVGTCSARDFTLPGGNDVSISWEATSDTDFTVNDTFTFVVQVPEYMTSSYSWSFKTGSGNIESIPTDTSTSPIGTIGIEPAAPLAIVSVSPAVRDTNVDTTTHVITIEFNKDLDATSITDLRVNVEALPVNGDPDIPSYGNMQKILRIDGKYLYIILQSGEDPTI